MNREEQFLRDYGELKLWAEGQGLKLRNHTSLNAVSFKTGESRWAEIVCTLGPLENADALADSGERDVLVMLGCQFGLGVPRDHPVMKRAKQWIALARMSVLSGHYIGVAAYLVENGQLGKSVKTFEVRSS